MPFITEELWSLLSTSDNIGSISVSNYPTVNKEKISEYAEKKVEFVQTIVGSIRNIRGEMNIPPSKKIDALIKTDLITRDQLDYIKSLGRVNEIDYGEDIEKPSGSASSILKNCEIYIPLKGIIDLEIEKERLSKEIKRLEGALIGVDKKLSNEKFINNAPENVIEKEKGKKNDWENSLLKLKSLLNDIS
jgi:valyl-tRNA synthetase